MSVATCDNYMVQESGCLAVMLFEIMTGVIVGVALFDRWIFIPESAIANVYFVENYVGSRYD